MAYILEMYTTVQSDFSFFLLTSHLHLFVSGKQFWDWYMVRESKEKEMATHSSILAWKIPWTEEPGGLQSMGSQRIGHEWATSLSQGVKNPGGETSNWISLLCNVKRLRYRGLLQVLKQDGKAYLSPAELSDPLREGKVWSEFWKMRCYLHIDDCCLFGG